MAILALTETLCRESLAGAARPTDETISGFAEREIFASKFVPVLAVGARGIDSREKRPSSNLRTTRHDAAHVFCVRDGFNVPRIDARFVSTQVIHFKTYRNGSDEMLIRDGVRLADLAFLNEAAVPSTIAGGVPKPTLGHRWLDDHFTKEPAQALCGHA